MLWTPNFYRSEFIRPGDKPTPQQEANMRRTAEALQMLRTLWGKPIIITSGFRTPARQQEVGVAEFSAHLLGLAVDFWVDGIKPKDVQHLLRNHPYGMGRGKTFTHLDFALGTHTFPNGKTFTFEPFRRWRY